VTGDGDPLVWLDAEVFASTVTAFLRDRPIIGTGVLTRRMLAG
jgi:hypothetical protein